MPACTVPKSDACCTAICTARRERNDGLYRVITYLVAKILEEVFIALLSSIAFGARAARGL